MLYGVTSQKEVLFKLDDNVAIWGVWATFRQWKCMFAKDMFKNSSKVLLLVCNLHKQIDKGKCYSWNLLLDLR